MSSDGMTITDKYVFFWHSPLGQWHPSPFVMGDQHYVCAEQYMMAMKARLFHDDATLQLIMTSKDPREQKKLGRQVKGFNDTRWRQHCKQFVYDANYAKFKSDPTLYQLLESTGDKELVEASPYDKLWGIGMAVDHPNILNKGRWLGSNWLGQVLMQVRHDLRKERQQNPVQS